MDHDLSPKLFPTHFLSYFVIIFKFFLFFSSPNSFVQTLKQPFDYDFYSHSICMLKIYIFVLCLYVIIKTLSLPPFFTHPTLRVLTWKRCILCNGLFYLEILWGKLLSHFTSTIFSNLKSIFRDDTVHVHQKNGTVITILKTNTSARQSLYINKNGWINLGTASPLCTSNIIVRESIEQLAHTADRALRDY